MFSSEKETGEKTWSCIKSAGMFFYFSFTGCFWA